MTLKKKIVIASIAKDIEKTFHKDYFRILNSFSDFEIVKWIIIESNSIDNSISVLREFASGSNILHFESLNDSLENETLRTKILAAARNKYLYILRELPNTNEIKYLVVCDLNNLNNKLQKKSILSCWDVKNWAAVTSNQSGPYYDIWALRHKFWNYTDCWESYSEMNKIYGNSKLALWNSVYSKMIKIPQKSIWINVDSAFGGLAIYDTKYIDDCSYNGITPNGTQICEHVSFNQGIKNNLGEIYINPKLINFKYTNHSRRKLLFLILNIHLIIGNLFTSKTY
jgi:hypothetical protein